MSVGVSFRSSSEKFSVSCEGSLIQPDDLVLPPATVDLLAPGGVVVGWISVADSQKSPGEWVVLQPYLSDGTRMRQEIVELGKMRVLSAFRNLAARCSSYVGD